MKPFPDLTRLVAPRSIVIVGASAREGSQGRRLVDNVLVHSGFDGEVYLVNPGSSEILGRPCYPSVADIPARGMDVALVIVNSALVLPALEQCAAKGIRFAIVMTSGFAETGEAGQRNEEAIAALCARTGLRVYGPNCPGLVNLNLHLGMTFSPAFKDDLNSGPIGLATQGGGLGRTVLQTLSFGAGVGLWCSAGNECDLGVPDFIAHMALDPQISVIATLMEGIKDGGRLRRALILAHEHSKPVVVLKIGHSAQGVLAAQSHTASIAGSAQVNSAVFRQHGAVEVQDLDELAAVARLLVKPRPAAGAGLAIFTFSGGTAALAADIAGAANLPLATFAPQTTAALKQLLPAFANIVNPLDTTVDIIRDPALVIRCLRIVCEDPNIGAVMFPIPMDYADITATMADAICEVAAAQSKPIVPVWMTRRMGTGFQSMEHAGLLPFLSLADCVTALRRLWPASSAVPATIAPHKRATPPSTHTPEVLSETQAKHLLRAANIAVPEGGIAHDPDAAARLARAVGYPVAMKIVSAQIPHKTEAGGVRLNLTDEKAVRLAYQDILDTVTRRQPDARIDGVLVEKMLPEGGREILIGVHRDAAFGLILTVGLGGVFVEILKDVAHRALPLQKQDAHAMLRELKGFAMLESVRGRPSADLTALEDMLLRVSDFAEAHAPRLRELDINPVWVGNEDQGAIALDALIVLDH
ncbi:MAG: acetate--CoA ligase family protein [Burkholderiaceae bacterium]|jgi:acyl-CoA synthetase (NDP forming)|nr:acetate--CoA ligase family protein [Burkholderiaceae bacterium]